MYSPNNKWVDEHRVLTESEVEAPSYAVFSVDHPEKLEKILGNVLATQAASLQSLIWHRDHWAQLEVELWPKPKTLVITVSGFIN